MHSRSDKLAKGRSYPVKASVLAIALEASGLGLPVELTNWDRLEHAFQADFLPHGWPKRREHEFIWIHCRAVSSSRVAEAREAIEREAIPRFIRWTTDIETLDASSPVRQE